jgi:Tfp pilus assembly protein PilZ
MRTEELPEDNWSEYAKLRRAARYYFNGVVELIDLESGRLIVALVRALSLYGCFVKTDQSFRLGAKLVLKMTHSGTHFSANGRVVNQTEVGIGVEFTEIDPIDRAVWKSALLNWLEATTLSGSGRRNITCPFQMRVSATNSFGATAPCAFASRIRGKQSVLRKRSCRRCRVSKTMAF